MAFKCFVCLTILIFVSRISADSNWESPCPRLFVYEPPGREPDRWYGIVTLLSDSELQGVWFRLILDRRALQLGNWFGEVRTTDNTEFLIHNRNHKLLANSPQPLRFYIRYDTSQPPPKVVGFRLNAKTVCPEGVGTTEAPTTVPRLYTSDDSKKTNGNKQNWQSSNPAANVHRPEPALNEICGKRVNLHAAAPLVRYGQNSSEGEWPWHAAVYKNEQGALNCICGGSLVSKWLVVTAAHCVTDLATGYALNPRNFFVHLGTNNLKDFSSGIQTMQISKIKVHPEYSLPFYHNDIALMRTTKPVDFTPYVIPICLWEGDVNLHNVVGRLGTVAGWGLDEKDVFPDNLRQIRMPIVDTTVCIYSKPDFFAKFTSLYTFCAGFRNGTSACIGDSGSGMVLDSNDRWYLRGIVSVSVKIQDKRSCDPYEYVIFTDAAKYVSWIKKYIDKYSE